MTSHILDILFIQIIEESLCSPLTHTHTIFSFQDSFSFFLFFYFNDDASDYAAGDTHPQRVI